ncbi:MAG TPA: hypothetical protein VG520_07285 [Candidatus Dormibacteraeota bacterium]|nr:hypothetical protein [Candidatus Dormibacteraeota bacterium]
MSDEGAKVSRVMRFLASGGYADQDADVVAALLARAQALAEAVVSDQGASGDTRAAARSLLEELSSETFD